MDQYLVNNEKSLIFFMRDVFTVEELRQLPFSLKCRELLEKAYTNSTFNGIDEEDATLLFYEFIEPIAARDIMLERINPIFIGIQDSCLSLIKNMPISLRNQIYSYR